MADVYKAKKRKEIEGREKPFWVDVGFTVIRYDKDGQSRLSLIDERTGESYALFKFESRDDRAQSGGGGFAADSGDVPF
jgi:hypothetical protein